MASNLGEIAIFAYMKKKEKTYKIEKRCIKGYTYQDKGKVIENVSFMALNLIF